MTFAGHLAATGIIVRFIPDPTAVVAVNLLIHPILDMVPHAEWTSFPENPKKALLITAVDVGVALPYLYLFLTHLDKELGILLTAIGAGLWLDIVDPLFGRYWPSLRQFHQATHSWPLPPTPPVDWPRTLTGRTPLWLKLAVQFSLVTIGYITVLGLI